MLNIFIIFGVVIRVYIRVSALNTMQQNMTQPDPESAPFEFILHSVVWYPEEMMLDFWVSGLSYSISYGDNYFDSVLPDGECQPLYRGMLAAMLDDFFNLHFLVRDFTGHVLYRTVYLKPILEDIAEQKYNY